MVSSNGLEGLLRAESIKCSGILNGIDAEVWDPAIDSYLPHHFKGNVTEFKAANKYALQQHFQADLDLPVVTFIGRLVREKGADLIPDLIAKVLSEGLGVTFLILGTGEPHIHKALVNLQWKFNRRCAIILAYNEGIAHQLYAGSDFLLMPSRVEPCGLNQMYALRYGTIPMVRDTGGLHDTVIDMGDEGGFGIKFLHANEADIVHAIDRAIEVYKNKPKMQQMITDAMSIDHSWESVVKTYQSVYESIV
jgi:starch synthase